MLKERIDSLGLPDFPATKAAALDMLLHEEYGYLPPAPISMSWEVLETTPRFCAGKAPLTKVQLNCVLDEGKVFSFPVYCMIPADGKKHPAFLHLNFRTALPDTYQPSEELCDNGYAVFTVCYNDITRDNNDFESGLAGILYENGQRKKDTDCGKIAMWAWGAHRVMDYICTLPEIEHSRVTVVGHSRLGKTALLAGATDERFFCSVSNDSGCSGAAITREKQGERVKDIVDRFPFWFCKNYYKYSERESEMPFDQHWLIGCIAPRYAYVCSAEEDLWADPVSEHLACYAAGAVYGEGGFVTPDRAPQVGDIFHGGRIGYHLRRGMHFLSREDWLNYMRFLEGKL
ncbi:MAG: hypothetical protein IKT81_03845 [Clostridia bacterium]|nr:hypothetical protein [Clostridia bacterium]